MLIASHLKHNTNHNILRQSATSLIDNDLKYNINDNVAIAFENRITPVVYWFVSFSTASTTCSTLIPFIQRKSIGHSRRKQGEQGAFEVKM